MLCLMMVGVCWFSDTGRYQPYPVDLNGALYTIIFTKDLNLSGTYIPFLCSFLRCNITIQHWIHLRQKKTTTIYYIRLNEFIQCII